MSSRIPADRGQAHTLESVVAAVLLLTAVAFALQVTIVTPLSASTSSQHIEGQQRAVAQGVLADAAADGSLKDAVLYYNETEGQFHNADARGKYTQGPPDNRFGDKLARAFDEEGIAYNVNVYYRPSSDTASTSVREMIDQGTPSDNAVTATRTITLRNDDKILDENERPTQTSVNSSSNFYISHGSTPSSGQDRRHGLYNTVKIEVVAWRI